MSIKQFIISVPLVGYSIRLVARVAKLPKETAASHQRLDKIERDLGDIHVLVTEIKGMRDSATELLQERIINLDSRLVEISHQLMTAEPAAPTASPTADSHPRVLADDHLLDKFYIEFENRYRGSEDDIKQRQEVYLPYFKKISGEAKQLPILDIGCGRGEFLALLSDNMLPSRGLDMNVSMVEAAKAKGHKAELGEALEYLKHQPTNSYQAITGFHIVEHIPFSSLIRLLAECYRTVAPGGLVIFETPNPENLNVGAHTFYMDPSHLSPLPPELLKFALESRGFVAEILRLHPLRETHHRDKLLDEALVMLYGPRDYAIIGRKH